MNKAFLCSLLGITTFLMVSLAGCACQHEWTEATCTEAAVCAKCGETDGEPLGHDWDEATCTEPKTCKACGETEGKALGHTVEQWEEAAASTCTEAGKKTGICTVCGDTIEEKLPLAEHTRGDWETVTAAKANTPGVRAVSCTVCGKELEREEFTMSAEEIKQEYVAKCSSYTYGEIARNPESYTGKYAKITGEVIQVMEDGNSYTLRVNITRGSYFWSDTILVTYTKQDSLEDHILEDDIITMYGMLMGTYTYKTVLGSEMTVPLLLAEYIDIQ